MRLMELKILRLKRGQRHVDETLQFFLFNLCFYRLDRDSRKVYRPYVLQEFRKAFKLWSDASPLRFQELAPGSGSKADIVVRFEARDHGDRYQFDGPGLTLAHAFPPSGASSLSGDLHMDDDEDWAVNSEALKDTYTKTSIFVVAAHELGHSLGLDHSSDDQAIMYAAYMGAKDYLTLPPDDKLGIKALYGKLRVVHFQR